MDPTVGVNVNNEQNGYSNMAPAKFVENIEEFLALPENGNDASMVLKKLDEQHAQYKIAEMLLLSKRKKLKIKIPELNTSLSTIKKLQETSTETVEQYFAISDQAYLKSEIKNPKMVYLHLGANIIVEYEIGEAALVLSNHISTAKKNLGRIESDLGYIKDQIIITEVSMSRVHNWRVKNMPKSATKSGF